MNGTPVGNPMFLVMCTSPPTKHHRHTPPPVRHARTVNTAHDAYTVGTVHRVSNANSVYGCMHVLTSMHAPSVDTSMRTARPIPSHCEPDAKAPCEQDARLFQNMTVVIITLPSNTRTRWAHTTKAPVPPVDPHVPQGTTHTRRR